MGYFQYFQDSGLLKMGWIQKSQEILFFRNKSPCGSVPQKVTFSELTLRELIHFYRDLKNGGTPIFVILVTFFQDFANFGRKPKWSVWSIRTTFKGWDWKLLTEKKELWTKTENLEGSKN